MVSGIVSDRIGRRADVVLFAAACVVMVLVYIFAPLTFTDVLAGLSAPGLVVCGTAA